MTARQGAFNRGFTFLELLITIVLLVLGVVPVVGALAAGVAADKSVEMRVLALTLAQEQMESVKAKTFATVASQARSAVSGFSGYDSEVVVSGTDPKAVTVNVYWMFQGHSQQVTLDTLIANLTGV